MRDVTRQRLTLAPQGIQSRNFAPRVPCCCFGLSAQAIPLLFERPEVVMAVAKIRQHSLQALTCFLYLYSRTSQFTLGIHPLLFHSFALGAKGLEIIAHDLQTIGFSIVGCLQVVPALPSRGDLAGELFTVPFHLFQLAPIVSERTVQFRLPTPGQPSPFDDRVRLHDIASQRFPPSAQTIHIPLQFIASRT